jgi:hypothetical protein
MQLCDEGRIKKSKGRYDVFFGLRTLIIVFIRFTTWIFSIHPALFSLSLLANFEANQQLPLEVFPLNCYRLRVLRDDSRINSNRFSNIGLFLNLLFYSRTKFVQIKQQQ